MLFYAPHPRSSIISLLLFNLFQSLYCSTLSCFIALPFLFLSFYLRFQDFTTPFFLFCYTIPFAPLLSSLSFKPFHPLHSCTFYLSPIFLFLLRLTLPPPFPLARCFATLLRFSLLFPLRFKPFYSLHFLWISWKSWTQFFIPCYLSFLQYTAKTYASPSRLFLETFTLLVCTTLASFL